MGAVILTQIYMSPALLVNVTAQLIPDWVHPYHALQLTSIVNIPRIAIKKTHGIVNMPLLYSLFITAISQHPEAVFWTLYLPGET